MGDHVGGGGTYAYSQANSILTLAANGRLLTITIHGDERWKGEFEAPSGVARFQPASYTGINSHPNQQQPGAGLRWSGDRGSCDSFVGGFTVDSVTYTGNSLTAITLTFVQTCHGGSASLRGTVHWRADDATRPPPPQNPPPAVWRPPSTFIPASGNYVYLQSDVGDYVGAGQTYVYTPATASITVVANGRSLSVALPEWSGRFEAMDSISQLEVGYYGTLHRYPFHNPTKGGFYWSGMGRGCNTLVGWFVVDHVTYAGVALTGIDLRFEQHCSGDAPALRGALRWRA